MKPIELLAAVAVLGSALHVNAEIPTVITYQGRVQVSGANFTGTGQFKFALVDGGSNAVTHWSNDGSSAAGSEPAAAVSLPVAQGLFTALLGDATVPNMTAIPPDVLTNRDVRLRIWFNDGANGFAALSPDQPLTSAPYALHALNAGAVTGPVSAALLTGTIAPANLADGGIEASKLAASSVTSVKIADGTIQLSDLSSGVSNAFWRLGGNNGTIPGTNFLGTTDNRPLEFRVNGGTGLRILPNFFSPNIVGGYAGNEVVGNIPGVVIAGGGHAGDAFGTNRVSASFSTISGGKGHTVAADLSAVGGGFRNSIEWGAFTATISGGRSHTIQSNSPDATIGGGQNNNIGTNAMAATIAGGLANRINANAERATIGGGYLNSIGANYGVIGGGLGNAANGSAGVVSGGTDNGVFAAYSAIAGGQDNRVNGNATHTSIGGGSNNVVGLNAAFAIVPGGKDNQVSARLGMATGHRAKANHQGAFVWADSQDADFASTTSNQFNVRASGGVRFETSGAGVTVDGQSVIAGQVNAAQLADGAVTAAKLSANSVTSTAITTGAVDTSRLATGAVTAEKISTRPAIISLTTITNPFPTPNSTFGAAVAGLGSRLVVVGDFNTAAGRAYLFTPTGTLQTTITNPTSVVGEWFGSSLAAAGSDRVLVGAPFADTGATESGAAYLFNTNGTLLTTFNNPSPAAFDNFGYSVSALGMDRVLIGGGGEGSGTNLNAAAYLYGTDGTLLTIFTNPAPQSGTGFGLSLAAVGSDRVLIGAYADDTGAIAAGAAYLFSTNGTLLITLTNPAPAVDDWFGFSVAAVGNDRVLIGAFKDDIGGYSYAGAAYLLSTNGTLLTTFTNPNPGNAEFGVSVAEVPGDRVLIGAHRDDTGGDAAGAAYLFTTSGDLLAAFHNPVPNEFDKFGFPGAALGNSQVLIGADTGEVYLFTLGGVAPGLYAEGVAVGAVDTINLADNAVYSAKIADGTITTEDLASATLNGTFWKLTGNGATVSGTHFLGTTDNQPLELKVNNVRALRLEPTASTPNLIGGYSGNSAASGVDGGFIGGGGSGSGANQIAADYTTIGGGLAHGIQSTAQYATISGGRQNTIQTNAQYSAIGGGYLNTVSVDSLYSVVDGGYRNLIHSNSSYATIGGGRDNTNGPVAHYSSIHGGYWNAIHSNAQASVIAGGIGNTVSNDAQYSTISGGYSNRIFAAAFYSTIAGGTANTNGHGAHYSTIGGGWQNDVRSNAQSSVAAGGYRNVISNSASYCVIAGGAENRIDGGAWYSTIAGGFSNRASAFYTFAAGQQARARDYGSFVWSDGSIGAVSSFGANTFTARAAGGARFYTIADLSVGVNLPAGGGAWAPISDRAVKDNVRPVDGREVLEKVAALPLNTWNYKSQDAGIRHIGPMAQDFHAAFGVGEDDRHITTIDADGVALAAIQGLNKKLEQELQARDAEIGELMRAVSELRKLMQGLTTQRREGE